MKKSVIVRVVKCWLAMALIGPSVCALFAKSKDDIVVMANGDRFTGEIKELRNGELTFKSDYMKDSVQLDWKKVTQLESKDAYIVGLSNGDRVAGTISKPPINDESPYVQITEVHSAIKVGAAEVITIEQNEVSVWNQLTGSVTYGFGFASGNSTNSSLGANVAYTTEVNSIQLGASSQFDAQSNAKNANRITFDSEYARTLTSNWSGVGLFSLLKSNQQDLHLRTTYGGALARRLIQTDRTNLAAMGGLAYSHENYVPQAGREPIRNNLEALAGLSFSTFRFKTLDISSQTFVLPSLSDPGRIRFSSRSNLRIELIRNFTWNLQVYENYDTRPPFNAPKNDLGITTSLGWTF